MFMWKCEKPGGVIKYGVFKCGVKGGMVLIGGAVPVGIQDRILSG